MKFISSKYFKILVLLTLSFIILQVLDFQKVFNYPWFFGVAKFLVFISTFFVITRLSVHSKKKYLLAVLYFILVILTYELHLWKFTASYYLEDVRQDYAEVVEILNEKDSFGRVFYRPEADSLSIIPSNSKHSYSNSELNTIKNFMKENWYVEIWKERFGIALIHNRFIDNRRGFILCDNQQCREAMNSNEQSNESYTQFNDKWYYFTSN